MKCSGCGAQMIVMPPAGGGEVGGPPALLEKGRKRKAAQVTAPARPPVPAEITDLPAPVGPTPTPHEVVDLPAPKRPSGVLQRPPEIPDLPVPVGPTPTKGIVDLPVPVGPTPTRMDMLTPVGPVPTRGIDLPAPVGEHASGFDLPSPVGPVPTRGIGLPAPVGPIPSRGIDVPAPVGPVPTRGVDLPAPKGFFDDAPPPASGSRPRPSELTLDDLDVVPAEPPSAGQAPLEFPAAATDATFSMDSLTLETPHEMPAEPPSFGNVDLPEGPTQEMPGVVSFGRPTGPATTDALDIAEPVRKKKPGSLADAPAKAVARAPVSRRTLLVVLLVIAGLAGGAYYVYQSVELEAFGIMTAPAKERRDKIDAGLKSARKLITADDWYQAANTAERASALDDKGNDLLGLAAQAYLAAAVDQGLNEAADKARADALLQKAQGRGAPGVDTKVAQALRTLIDGKPADADTQLAGIGGNDPNVPLYRGWAALETGDFAAATTAFSAALHATPGRVPALYGLGRAQFGAGQKDKARETFHQLFDKQKHYGAWLALTEIERPAGTLEREKELGVLCESAAERDKAHPRDVSRAWTLYAREATAAGRWDQAADRFRKARAMWDRNFDAAVGGALVDVELKTNGAAVDLAQASQILAKAVELEPKRAEVLVALARISLLDGRLDEAKKAIDVAVTADATFARARYWQGKIEEAFDEREAAQAAYLKSMELAPKDFVAHVALAQLLSADARKADREGKRDKAKALNDQVLKVLAPVAEAAKTDPKLALTLGNAYMGARDPIMAERWFRAAVELDAANVDARLALAQSLEQQKKLDEAVAEYVAALDKAPRRDDIALGLAEVYVKRKNLAAADKLFDKLLSTEGGATPTPRVRAAAARYYMRVGKEDVALAQRQPLEAADPTNPAVAFLRGVQLLHDKRREEAVKSLKDAVAAASEPEYWSALGAALEAPSSLPEAQAAYQEASRLDETYAEPIVGLTRIHITRREFGAALREANRAATIDPGNAELWAMMGDAHYELTRYPEAIEAYKQSLARAPNAPEILYKLGKAYDAGGDGRGTIETLNLALEKGAPNDEWRPEALRKLGLRYRTDARHKDMCDAFDKYLQIAAPTDRNKPEIKGYAASCP